MNCAWNELLRILPPWLEVKGPYTETLQELRLRLEKPPELVTGRGRTRLERKITREDLNFVINTASRYSPWAAQTLAQGYLTAPGGHRIGVCGEAVVRAGEVTGMRQIRMLCIRVARDFPGIGKPADKYTGSILVLGPPGSGKTTLLRDLVRRASARESVCVVDERGELFPAGFDTGGSLDVLSNCPKVQGIDMVLRTMGPSCIAVDEITAEADCEALLRAGWCGVRLLATAHAASVRDLRSRPVYQALNAAHLFDHILVLSRDKSWREERMDL